MHSRSRRGPIWATGRSPPPIVVVDGFGDAEAATCASCSALTAWTLSSLAYYDNNLHPDPDERGPINDHVHRCIDAAALLGCPTVGTFVGRDPVDGSREPA